MAISVGKTGKSTSQICKCLQRNRQEMISDFALPTSDFENAIFRITQIGYANSLLNLGGSPSEAAMLYLNLKLNRGIFANSWEFSTKTKG